MVTGRRASGIVIGHDQTHIYVATAAHVVGPLSTVSVELVKDFKSPPLKCLVLAPSKQGNASQSPPDLAVLKCKKENAAYRFSYDVVGDVRELRPGARLTLIGNFGEDAEWKVPLGYFVLKEVATNQGGLAVNVEYINPLHLSLAGASGGPLLTDRSELLGLQFKQVGDLGDALAWPYARKWILEHFDSVPIKLSRRARSAPALRPGNVEFSASSTSVFVPSFGWLATAPKFRVAAALPNLSNLNVAFDFTFAEATKHPNGFEKLSLVIPAITAEYQLGSSLGPLRRRELLGGIYIGAGIAPLFLKDTLQLNQQQSNIQAWTGVFDAGWRYRLPGRGWGITASYREGILFGEPAQGLYPRFRSIGGGLFVVFR
jgi:hypothetical protein